MTELPWVIIDVQRASPSNGLPTKTEQRNLLTAMLGRHGEAPMLVLAAASLSDCFAMTLEAARLALKFTTPVLVLSDGYIGQASEPWRVPQADTLPDTTGNDHSVAIQLRNQVDVGHFFTARATGWICEIRFCVVGFGEKRQLVNPGCGVARYAFVFQSLGAGGNGSVDWHGRNGNGVALQAQDGIYNRIGIYYLPKNIFASFGCPGIGFFAHVATRVMG